MTRRVRSVVEEIKALPDAEKLEVVCRSKLTPLCH